MNTREELEKIIDRIDDILERMDGKSDAYKSGAYEVFLDFIRGDLSTINEILELRERRK